MPRRRHGPDFMLVPWWSSGGPPYWIGLDAFSHINTSGIADATMPMVYRGNEYNVLREIVASALAGYQMAGEFGIDFHEDSQGKSWFLLNTHGLGDRINTTGLPGTFTSYTYYLGRLALNGASFERLYPFVLNVSSIGQSDLTIPVPFVTDSGYHAAFAIGPDDQIWIPTPAGAQAVHPETGALVGPPVAWPVVLFPFNGAGMGGIDHDNWQLRGFRGSSGGILAQLWWSSTTTTFVDPGQVPHLSCDDVRWQWWYLPWATMTWTRLYELVITDTTSRPFSYWIPGGPFGGSPPGAPLSPWDFFYDVGGWAPALNAFHGVLSRALVTDNRYERDYELTSTDGLVVRDEDTNFRRRRPVRLSDGTYWSLAAANQVALHVHQRLANRTTISVSQTVSSPPIITSPMSPWRRGKGPAT
jgi:hypothetical protein